MVFQLSRYASHALQNGKKAEVFIDCLPSVSTESLSDMLQKKLKEENISEALTGILPKKMIPVILEQNHIKKASVRPDADQLISICHSIKNLKLTINGTRSFDQAQICGGGILVSEIDQNTMESRICPDFYLTGELIDIDGICGGYNLQWAWSTGYIAGKNCARKGMRHD